MLSAIRDLHVTHLFYRMVFVFWKYLQHIVRAMIKLLLMVQSDHGQNCLHATLKNESIA